MENYQGDLADMVRASTGMIRAFTTFSTTNATTTTTTTTTDEQMGDWQFRSSNTDLCPLPDLLLTNMDNATTGTGSLSPFIDAGLEDPQNTSSYGGGVLINNNFNMFTRALQISSDMYTTSSTNTNNDNNARSIQIVGDSARVTKAPCRLLPNETMNINGSSSSSTKDEILVDRCTSGAPTASLRNLSNKRRKSQAKKVVCIPAPTGAHSRQTGEVVPSDLWAWRKYGQKPIKDSPYPRGYYRCSSSKGCSARKQVERSRTDPNMLVITYTSEHNHPWPTQRNALAGSTRSQPSKINPTATSPKPLLIDELLVKKEAKIQKHVETDNFGSQGHNGHICSAESYKPTIMHDQELNAKHPQQDFPMELSFDGDDPLNLIFNQESKALDPFNGLLDWVAPHSAIN